MSCLLSFSTTGECFFSLLLTLSLSLLFSALLSLFLGFSSPAEELDEEPEEDSCTNLGASSRTSEEEEEERFGLRPFFPFLCDDDDEDEAAPPSALLDLSCRVFICVTILSQI